MIIFGNKSGGYVLGSKNRNDPDDPGKFSPDVCGGGGSKNTWVPPGPKVGFLCQKAKDRAYCSRMKDCGDTSVSDRWESEDWTEEEGESTQGGILITEGAEGNDLTFF